MWTVEGYAQTDTLEGLLAFNAYGKTTPVQIHGGPNVFPAWDENSISLETRITRRLHLLRGLFDSQTDYKKHRFG